MKYTINDINIGDGIFFELNGVSNQDLYWTVLEKDLEGKWVRAEVDPMGHQDSRFIPIERIIMVEKRKKNN